MTLRLQVQISWLSLPFRSASVQNFVRNPFDMFGEVLSRAKSLLNALLEIVGAHHVTVLQLGVLSRGHRQQGSASSNLAGRGGARPPVKVRGVVLT